jgi:hypothetical protein
MEVIIASIDLPIAALQRALQAAVASIDAFARRIGRHLEQRWIEDAFRLGRIVAGLEAWQ